jgi:hypothetical protein
MDGNAVDCFRPSSRPQCAPQIRTAQSPDGACLSLWQLAPARLRDFNQGFDADQPSLVVLEPGGRFLHSSPWEGLMGRLRRCWIRIFSYIPSRCLRRFELWVLPGKTPWVWEPVYCVLVLLLSMKVAHLPSEPCVAILNV